MSRSKPVRGGVCSSGRKCLSALNGSPAFLSQWPYTAPTLCAKCYRDRDGTYPWDNTNWRILPETKKELNP